MAMNWPIVKPKTYFQDFEEIQSKEGPFDASTTSSPYYVPYNRGFPPISTPCLPPDSYEPLESMAVRNNTVFSPFVNQSSTSVRNPLETNVQNADKKCEFESNENQIEFKILVQYLENLRQNNQIFQTSILKEMKQMREVMADLKKSIQEMPIRFADALTQCLESVNSRSDALSVDSEPEIVDFFDKIDITNDCKEDNTFVEVSNNSSKELDIKTGDEKSGSIVNKFVFEYSPYIDLEKWLKKQ